MKQDEYRVVYKRRGERNWMPVNDEIYKNITRARAFLGIFRNSNPGFQYSIQHRVVQVSRWVRSYYQ